MEDATAEALKQALDYHSGIIGRYTGAPGEKAPKKPVPADVVATARIFYAFLVGKKTR